MRFPIIEDALTEVLADLAPVVAHIPKDPSSRAPFIAIAPIPSAGDTEVFLSQDRYLLEVFGTGRTFTRNLAYEIADRLDGNFFDTTHGLLDRVEVVINPNETPLEDDTLNSFNLSIVVHVRAVN